MRGQCEKNQCNYNRQCQDFICLNNKCVPCKEDSQCSEVRTIISPGSPTIDYLRLIQFRDSFAFLDLATGVSVRPAAHPGDAEWTVTVQMESALTEPAARPQRGQSAPKTQNVMKI